jgi:hypothetical protein
LLNYYLVNKSEPAYDKFKTFSTDFIILNDTFVYDVDKNQFLMFSFKTDLDYFNFTDTIKLNKSYNQPGYYGVLINYKDSSNDNWYMINLNVTSSNIFV